ncbi:MAG: CDP-diacylglycerol--serine O-phosphatidyltransferase [Verrucomicrobiales bacterium]|nr:CDP-diacylglycerol--serine O-phosphatidyltransferase [Verrucomicrobiales bacterium]MCP5526198.1 CDP-diacylglycerol--serine O-phosphatidyltransferase [Verrucomicrobiales bacterium]
MTGANLFCGFVALTKIVEANVSSESFNDTIRYALFFILLACIFDLLDGRLARWGGQESAFGREFDSLADLISFGAAPAFLVHRIVMHDVFVRYQEIGWFVASVYLICGALRLARFNCLATLAGSSGGREFIGFPIPAAAGLVASLTLFLMWLDDRDFPRGNWRYVLPVLLLFLSVMMISEVRYPAFKDLDLRARRPFVKLVIALMFLGVILVLRERILPVVLPVIFTAYLVYGFVRPRLSRRLRREIEEEDDDEEEPNGRP